MAKVKQFVHPPHVTKMIIRLCGATKYLLSSEAGEVKQELVKVMVCRKCAKKLFFIAQPEIFGGNHDNRSNSTNEAIAMKTGGDTSNCESPNCQDMKSVGDKITKRQRLGY